MKQTKAGKRLLSWVVVLLMVVGLLPGMNMIVYAEETLSGSGTSDDPYLIESAEDWNTFVGSVNSGETYDGKTVKLTADIGPVTEKIATGKTFKGTFDGGEHLLIVNFDFGNDAGALFPSVAGNVTVRNLILAGVIKGGNHTAGIIGKGPVGYSSNSSANIDNVLVCATLLGENYMGGIVGHTMDFHKCEVKDCQFLGTIKKADSSQAYFFGGMIGWGASCEFVVSNCKFGGRCGETRSFNAVGFCNIYVGNPNHGNPTITVSNVTSNLADHYTYANNSKQLFTGTYGTYNSAITYEGSSYSGEYDGVNHGIEVNVTNPGNSSIILYGENTDEYLDIVSPAFTGAGLKTVYYQICAKDYPTLFDQNNSITISAKPVTIKADNQEVYVDGNIDDSVDKVIADGLIDGHIIKSVSLTSNGTAVATNNGVITPTGAIITDNDDNDVTNNYEITYVNGVLTVNEKELATVTEIPTARTLSYNRNEQELVTAGTATGGTMQYVVGDATTVPTGGWDASIPKKKDAGTYYVWYKVAGDASHSDYVAEAPIEVNIAQRSIANAAVTLNATEFVYDGTDKTVAVTEVKLEDGSTILSPDTDYTVDGVSGRDKGTYTVTVTAIGLNYTGEATAIWSIGLATPVINELPITRPITYGQPLRDVPLEGGQGGDGENSVPGTFTWKTPDTVPEVSDSETTEYEVIFTPEDTNNYAPVTFRITVTVNKAESPAENPAPTPKEDLIDNGQPQNLINTVPVSGGTIEYVIGTDGSTPPTSGWGPNVPTAAAPGTYYVWYKVVGDNNHQDSVPKCITVTIAAAPAPSDGGNTPSDNSGSNGSGGTSGYVKDVTGTDEASGNYTFGQSIVNNGDLKTLLSLSDDEVSQGTKVWLDVADLGNNAPDSDKTLVESAKGDYTIGTYLDINLYKKVGNNEAVKITQTNGKMKVSIVLPESLRAEGRTFAAIRVHHDTAAALPATYDENSHKLSFETDGFSTYAIVYKDGAATGGNTSSNTSASTDNSSSGSNNTTTTTTSTVVPKTDGMSGIMVWSLMLILSLSTLGVVTFMRVKENR